MLYDSIKVFYNDFIFENLDLEFNGKKDMIIFGRNGSGKSTLSKKLAFSNIEEIENEYTHDCQFMLNGNVVQTKQLNNLKVHVYNNDFQNKYVSFSESTDFEAIVMLGDQQKYQNDLELYENSKVNLIRNIDECNEKIEIIKLDQEEDKLKKAFKDDNKWADRRRRIYGNKKNSSVNIEIIKKIHNKDYSRDKNTAEKNLWNYICDIESSRRDQKINKENLLKSISEVISKIDFNKSDVEIIEEFIPSNVITKIKTIGKTTINPTPYNEREKRILEVLKNYGAEKLDESIEMTKSPMSFCPTCYSEMSKQLKEELNISISKVIEEE
ncbi:AAA family ATPase, partial [Staphylococcus gallinarum]